MQGIPPFVKRAAIGAVRMELEGAISKHAELQLRPATRDDLPKIVKIELSVFTQPWNEPTFETMLDKGHQFWVAVTPEGDIAGYVVFGPELSPKEIHILTIAATPGWRRQGVGHMLLRKVVSYSEEVNADKITLVVRMSNEAARKLYQEFDFVPAAISPNYYADGESGIVMERPVRLDPLGLNKASSGDKTAGVVTEALGRILPFMGSLPSGTLPKFTRWALSPSPMAESLATPVIASLKNLGLKTGVTPWLRGVKETTQDLVAKEYAKRQSAKAVQQYLADVASGAAKMAAEQTPKILDGPDKTLKKIEVQGIPVNIERPKGAISLFPDKTTQFYKNDYGSIPKADGVDGDPLDVFVGPDKGSKRVFVVEKMDDKDHSRFDEHKVMLGFKDKDDARESAKFHLWGTDGRIKEVPLGTLQKALGVEKKAAEFAPGIPERSRFVGIPKIEEPKQWEFGVHLHKAHRAGEHFDLRLGDPDTGEAHSWAMKKLPKPGESTYAPQQPTHTVPYMDWKGEIPAGTYGAGTVDIARRGKTEVVKADENEIRFNVFQGRIPEQFALKKVPSQDGRMWVIHNITPSRQTKRWGELIPSDKPPMKAVKFDELDPTKPGTAWQPKVDGAHAIAVVEGGKPVKLFSYRPAKNETGLIEHTHKMPNYWKNVAPEGIRPTVIRGELAAFDRKGKPLPVAEISGLLNSGTEVSREVQKQKGVTLKFMAFDVDRVEGKKVTQLPYDKTQQILQDLAKQVPGIDLMPTVYDPAGKAKLKQEIGRHRHLLTREGIVERDIQTGAAIKGKQEEPYDVFIREVYAGTKPGEAGGFRFSHTEHGPVVGNVGSGLTRSDRKKMLAHPEQWVGRVAKVQAQQRLPSGALRMPIFHGFHESKGLQPFHEIATGDM